MEWIFQVIASGVVLCQRIALSCKKFQALANNFTYLQVPRKAGKGYAFLRLRGCVEGASKSKIPVLSAAQTCYTPYAPYRFGVRPVESRKPCLQNSPMYYKQE